MGRNGKQVIKIAPSYEFELPCGMERKNFPTEKARDLSERLHLKNCKICSDDTVKTTNETYNTKRKFHK